MQTIRRKARERMKGFCRVCPVCDGRSCAGDVPGMGGVGTGASFFANIDALAGRRLNMRLIHDVTEPDTKVTILGRCLDIPVLAAPIAGVSFNMGGKISEETYIASKLEACQAQGILGCTGDGAPDEIYQAGFSAIGSLDGQGIPFLKPWEDAELFKKVEEADQAGAFAVGMDIDAAGLITLKLMGRPVSPKPPHKLREIIKKIPLKFILKGIMTPDDAKLAVDAGADAIVVSNHGGRILEHTPGTAEVLPDIAAAVKGQTTILVDGGIRSGGDVLKMIALGADAVMIGRPFCIANMGGLKEGVQKLIDQFKSELIQAMILTGTKNLTDVDRSILYDDK